MPSYLLAAELISNVIRTCATYAARMCILFEQHTSTFNDDNKCCSYIYSCSGRVKVVKCIE